MQLFPGKLVKIWNGWEARLLVLVSLTLQVILVIFGAQRKFSASIKVRMLVWSAYMVADSVATLALGNLANSQVDSEGKFSEHNVLRSFWAPFLLLHLGGPDTITAYSLEDNELWLRHFQGFVVQFGVAFYIFLWSWSNTALTFIAIPVFITGVIKYGERTYVLRLSSMDRIRDFLRSSPFSDELKKRIDPNAHYLVQAYLLFPRSIYLFANLILDYYGQDDPSYSIINSKSAEDAFKLVEVELGFMYDLLFTKACLVYSRLGMLLRCITFFSSVSALVVFSITIDINSNPLADISLTYSLLVAAVFLEIYAFVLVLLSDWIKLLLIKRNTAQGTPIWNTLLHNLFDVTKPSKRRSRSMAQYNLLNSCLKYKSTTFIGDLIGKLVDISKLEDIWKYRYLTWKSMDIELQNMIFKRIQDNSHEVLNERQSLTHLFSRRGDYVLEETYSLDNFRWSTIEVDFDHSLLVWHIATDICYYQHLDENQENNKHNIESKALSDYMLYLLVFCPSMLHKGISHETRYRGTYNAIKSSLKQQEDGIVDKRSACELLLRNVEDNQVVNTMSVLHLGCRLARNLQELDYRLNERYEGKWKMISEVWMEMLVYAAHHCAWKDHGQKLGKGGELLTHVALVMAHLGLSEQYQLKKLYDNMPAPDRESSDLV